MTKPLICRGCGAALQADTGGGAICGRCGLVHAAPLTLCPQCRLVNKEGDAYCRSCGTALTAICLKCGLTNWGGASSCGACGGALHSIDHVFRTFESNYADQRKSLQSGLPQLRREEEAGSRERLSVLARADDARLQRDAMEAGRRMARQKAIIVIMSSAVLIFLLASMFLVYIGSR